MNRLKITLFLCKLTVFCFKADGTWTDEPRCIEHEPGKEEQIPGLCPGIPGYCSLDTPGGLCTFECPIGPQIRSTCTPDGTWEPYPTCQGDPRETQDGCNPCPGPLGAPRNRTMASGSGAEAGGQKNSISPAAKTSNRNNQNNNNNNRNTNASDNNRKSNGGTRNGNTNQGSGSRNTNSGAGHSPASRGSGGAQSNSLTCPGDVLQACIDVCPGFSARVFGACVSGCAKRCPEK